MCEFCTKHGDGQVWFKNAANYGRDLAADLRRRGYIKEFFTSTIEEGVSSLGRLESLFWTMMTPFIGAICNCRPAECLGLRTLNLEVELMFRGEQVAVVDEQLCNGCGACTEACQFQAIASRQTPDGDRAVISPLQCYGCGLCRNTCPTGALSMAERGR